MAKTTIIKITDTRIENATSTVTADIDAQGPLRVIFCYDGAMTGGYMDYETGLSSIMKSVCKNWQYVRQLKILVEMEDVNANLRRTRSVDRGDRKD